jgi:plastocyanin
MPVCNLGMRRVAPKMLALCLAAPAAQAGELDVTFVTAAGRPVPDAVVMVRPDSARGSARVAGPYVMAQKGMQFAPYVLIVPAGAEVSFPNLDPFHHHVYSFSKARPFELKLYGRDETRKVRFDRAGVVGVGCNIHDNMSAYIRVVDTPFAAKTAAGGGAVVRDLPAGGATVVVWHPHLKAPDGEVTRRVTIPASGAARLAVTGDLKPSRLRRSGY